MILSKTVQKKIAEFYNRRLILYRFSYFLDIHFLANNLQENTPN